MSRTSSAVVNVRSRWTEESLGDWENQSLVLMPWRRCSARRNASESADCGRAEQVTRTVAVRATIRFKCWLCMEILPGGAEIRFFARWPYRTGASGAIGDRTTLALLDVGMRLSRSLSVSTLCLSRNRQEMAIR